MRPAAIKIAGLAATFAMPLAFAAGAWTAGPQHASTPQVLKVFVDPRLVDHSLEGSSVPQFDSGDPRFVIDPDSTDDRSPNRSCAPTDDDCDDGPDDPALAVIRA